MNCKLIKIEYYYKIQEEQRAYSDDEPCAFIFLKFRGNSIFTIYTTKLEMTRFLKRFRDKILLTKRDIIAKNKVLHIIFKQ